jgi:uncharacterized hydrophobic protein (TIGR00271 family)
VPLEQRSRVLDELYYEGDRRNPYLWRFAALIVFSSSIAAFGLMNDSAAVVIGAMLIAPLMTPIMAFAGALVEAWGRRLVEQGLIVAGGAALAIAVGWACASLIPDIGPGLALPGEVLARTSPNLIDLGIALAAGAAGAYVTVRSEASSALPGVGIAVALVPPLATVGLCLEVGRADLAGGAFLLFLTNFAAISLAAGLTFAVNGFLPPPERIRNSRWAVVAIVAVILVITIPLAFNTIPKWERAQFAVVAAEEIDVWSPNVELEAMDVDATEETVVFEIVVTGDDFDADVQELAEAISDEIDRPAQVDLVFIPRTRVVAEPG